MKLIPLHKRYLFVLFVILYIHGGRLVKFAGSVSYLVVLCTVYVVSPCTSGVGDIFGVVFWVVGYDNCLKSTAKLKQYLI